MSLDWRIEEIENYEEVCWIKTDEKDEDGKPLCQLNPVTNSLIWVTLAVKIGKITEANADEFYARLKFIEQLQGCFLYKIEDGEKVDKPFTPEMVRAHIGLATNVSTETRAKFLSSFRVDLDRHTFAYKRSLKEAVAA